MIEIDPGSLPQEERDLAADWGQADGRARRQADGHARRADQDPADPDRASCARAYERLGRAC